MRYQYIPYIWPLIASALTSLSLGLYSLFKRKDTKCGRSFILSMFVVTIWSGANALEMAASNFPTKLFWANVQYLAYCFSPVTLLALCMRFTGYDKWLQNRKILWLAVIPAIIIILVWTDQFHGLMRYDMMMDFSGDFPVISKKYGPAFFIHGIYSHLLNIMALILLISAVFLKNTVYRKQAAALLAGASLIVVPNILYILGFSPVKRFDLTPVFFGPAGLIMAWSIFRFKFFDLIPIARAKVIDIMDPGVMILDLQYRVLDINPSFEKIIGLTTSQISAQRVEDVCSSIPELERACFDRNTTHTEFYIKREGLRKEYEVFLSPLTDSRGVPVGRLVVTYETTEKKQAQQEILKQQQRLTIIEERQRLARDMHDNLGQLLGFINFQAQGIRQALENEGVNTVSGQLDRMIAVTQSAHDEIRKYIRSIRQPESIEKDFTAALIEDVENFKKQTGLGIRLDIPDGFQCEQLKSDTAINVMNIIREALNNVRKHAEASLVDVKISMSGHQLLVCIEDDGKGFDIFRNENGVKTKYGLNIMCERTQEIGGQIEIESTIGKGSRIMLCVPDKGETVTDEIDVGR